MTAEHNDVIAAFAFNAQSLAGQPVSGTINAVSVTQASQKLHDLQLRVIDLDPLRATAQKPRQLGGGDFEAFNTQLAYLATAGLPIEKSLRLIAQDMQTGGLTQTINQVVNDLESGRTLPEAFALHAKQFPPLYSELVSAGIRTGNLPTMLLSLGRHLEMIKRLRGLVWQAAAYPLMVLASLLLVISFLGIFVFPQFKLIFTDYRMDLPVITQLMIGFSDFMVAGWPILLVILIAVLLAPPLLLAAIPRVEVRQHVKELFLFPIPVIGRAIKQNLLARWCDALKLGVEAGMDLPSAITLAGQAVGSPRLIADGVTIIQVINAGLPMTESVPTRLIPPTVMVVLSMAAGSGDLPSGLTTLSAMFQQQAEARLSQIPAVLTPLLMVLIAVIIGVVVIAMFAPIIALISAVSGPMK